jgi:hypothetical protein
MVSAGGLAESSPGSGDWLSSSMRWLCELHASAKAATSVANNNHLARAYIDPILPAFDCSDGTKTLAIPCK